MDTKSSICSKGQVERYLLNQMDDEEETAFQEHLLQCESCRTYLENLRKIAKNLQLDHSESKTEGIRVSSILKIRPYILVSAAASIILIVGLSFYFWKDNNTYQLQQTDYSKAAISTNFAELIYPPEDEEISIIRLSENKEFFTFEWNNPTTFELLIKSGNKIILDKKGNSEKYDLKITEIQSFEDLDWELKLGNDEYKGKLVIEK